MTRKSSLKFDFPRFNGKWNFGIWQQPINDFLTHEGMKKTILDSKPEPIVQMIKTRWCLSYLIMLPDDITTWGDGFHKLKTDVG